MFIDERSCVGCGECLKYCPMRAISLEGETARVDQDLCAECGVCARLQVCPQDAFVMPSELPWPRSIRSIFSDPLTEFEATGVTGRGTEEMKTNDVTERYKPGLVGMCVDVGRPNVGCRLRDIDTISRAIAPLGVEFEALNPVSYLMESKSTGALMKDVLDERVVSGIIEFTIPVERVVEVVQALKAVEGEVDTVFSVGVISRVVDGDIPARRYLESAGIPVAPNGKTNVGLGR